MSATPERRLAITPGTNIRWEPCYEMPDGEYNWALVSDESNRTESVLNPNTVLLLTGDCRTGEGKPIGEHPDLVLYADAHNTYNACGLTPSELLAKLKQAEDVVVHMVSAAKYHFKHGNDTNLDKQTDIAGAFLSTLNLPQ